MAFAPPQSKEIERALVLISIFSRPNSCPWLPHRSEVALYARHVRDAESTSHAASEAAYGFDRLPRSRPHRPDCTKAVEAHRPARRRSMGLLRTRNLAWRSGLRLAAHKPVDIWRWLCCVEGLSETKSVGGVFGDCFCQNRFERFQKKKTIFMTQL